MRIVDVACIGITMCICDILRVMNIQCKIVTPDLPFSNGSHIEGSDRKNQSDNNGRTSFCPLFHGKLLYRTIWRMSARREQYAVAGHGCGGSEGSDGVDC